MALFYEPFDYFGFPSARHRSFSPFEARTAPRRAPYHGPVLSYPVFVDFDEDDYYHQEQPVEQPIRIQRKKKQVDTKPPAPLELTVEEHGRKGWTASVELSGVHSTNDIELEIKDEDRTLLIRSSRGRKDVVALLRLPEGVDEEKVRAIWSNRGILTVVMPRLFSQKATEQPQEKPAAIEESKKETPVNEQPPKSTVVSEKKTHQPVSPFLNLWKHLSAPRVSTTQTESHIVSKMEFPEGIHKEHLDIEVNKGVLMVTASKKDEGCSFTFRQSLPIPKNLNQEDIKAKFEGSCLEISYPKPAEKKEKTSFKIAITSSSDSSPSAPSNPPSLSETPAAESKSESDEHHGQQTDSPKATKSEEVLIEDAVEDGQESTVATA